MKVDEVGWLCEIVKTLNCPPTYSPEGSYPLGRFVLTRLSSPTTLLFSKWGLLGALIKTCFVLFALGMPLKIYRFMGDENRVATLV